MIEYFTIAHETETVEVIEKSRFICNCAHVENEEEAREFIQKIRKKYSLANHWCYAYIADENALCQKFSDDGEPQGTAGMPMLNVLRNRKMYKTVAVVTRFFGGIKLGTGGLTRAYGGAVSNCLNNAKISQMQMALFYQVVTDYDGYVRILNKKNCQDFVITNTVFTDKVVINFAIKLSKENIEEEFKDLISNLTKGSAKTDKKSSGYYQF